ncbi:hypothetical protein C9374_003030 [Naegleria lovaniensis]|uniref:Uncharacterized protein n=1 Tax=Naegleria lovaniensis TaxID=51637 RepID=A0AA88GU72_NAELO|nr:uncharacterized protein C9374_003030 [Naegleria lovaniensis]KAG2385881.1 hypothetical protein C9374_003030 [Naegleria lovaniensis]
MLILNPLDGGYSNCCDKCMRDFSQQVSSTHLCHHCNKSFCSVHSNYHMKYFPYHYLTLVKRDNDKSDSTSSTMEETASSSLDSDSSSEDEQRPSRKFAFNEEYSMLHLQILSHKQQQQRIRSQFEDLKDDLKRWEQVHFRKFCNLSDEFEDIEKHRLELKLESQRIFVSLRKALYEREDEVSQNIDKICNEQKEMVMKISSLKNNLRIIMAEIEMMNSDESNYEKMERKLQQLNATIDSLKLQCQSQVSNGIQNYHLRYLPILQEIEQDIHRLCHLQKIN